MKALTTNQMMFSAKFPANQIAPRQSNPAKSDDNTAFSKNMELKVLCLAVFQFLSSVQARGPQQVSFFVFLFIV